ncbi:MAG: hypothetical protein FJ135_04380 [Deltaproteobacteria bacterium]|nr:hypothetical protein [Deltaproteobacteria bacterium]
MAQEVSRKPFVISRAYMERQVKFNSHDAQIILQGFGRLAGAMYRLGISLRAYLPPEKVSAFSDALYEELVEPLQKKIGEELALMEALCQQHQVQPVENYTRPIDRKLRYYYPKVGQILDIAQSLDTLVCRLNDLWFHGHIGDAKYFELKEAYRSRLLHIARRIRTLATTKMEEARARVAARERAGAQTTAAGALGSLVADKISQAEARLVAREKQGAVEPAASPTAEDQAQEPTETDSGPDQEQQETTAGLAPVVPLAASL